MNRIKIGQIGVCHEHASGKIQALRRRPDVFDLVGVVDDRASAAAKFAGGDVRPYEGLSWLTEEALFQTPGLRAVTVETPNEDLVPAALRCLERGVAVHMDKPGGEDLALFTRMRRGFAARGLPFQMGYMFRNNPALQWCLQAARRGWLGEIFEIQADMSHNYGGEAYQDYLGRFRGGILFNLGCHLIDFVVAMLGRPAKIVPFLKTAPGDSDGVVNHGLAVLEYPRALAGVRACSREVGGFPRRRLMKIGGLKGTVELCPLERFDGQPLRMRLTLAEPIPGYAAGAHTLDFGVVQDRYEDQLLELAREINGELESPWSCEHDCLVQEVLLAAAGCRTWKG